LTRRGGCCKMVRAQCREWLMSRAEFTRAVLTGAFAAVLAGGSSLAQMGQDEFSDQIVRNQGPGATNIKIEKDTWEGAVGKAHPSGVIKVPAEQVKDVIYGSAPPGFSKAKRNAKRGALSSAIRDFEQLLGKVKEPPQLKQYVLYWLGYCYLYRGKQGDLAKSRKYFTQLMSEVKDTRFVYQAMLYKADTYYYEQNWSGAKRAYQEAMSKFESLGRTASGSSLQRYCMKRAREAEYWGVRVIEAQGEYEKAKSAYGQLEVRTDDADVRIKAQAGRGRCLLRLGLYSEAKKLYERMIEQGTKAGDSEVLGQAYCGLGDCYYEEKDYSRARWNYLKVVVRYYTVEPNYVAKAHLFAGRCYVRLAKQERDAMVKAKRHLKIVLEEYPDSIWVKDAKSTMKGLGG